MLCDGINIYTLTSRRARVHINQLYMCGNEANTKQTQKSVEMVVLREITTHSQMDHIRSGGIQNVKYITLKTKLWDAKENKVNIISINQNGRRCVSACSKRRNDNVRRSSGRLKKGRKDSSTEKSHKGGDERWRRKRHFILLWILTPRNAEKTFNLCGSVQNRTYVKNSRNVTSANRLSFNNY